MEEEYEFDFDEILKEFRNGKKLTGKGGLLAPLIKLSVPEPFGHRAGVDVDSVPKGMWTPCRRT